MSKFKQSENLFIGKQELDRMMKFMDEDGFRRFFTEQTVSYGIIKTSVLGDFNNAKVQLGTNPGTIKVNEVKAVDKNTNFLYSAAIDNLAVPNNGSWYWIQVEYVQSSFELGIFNIDAQGNLTGAGSELTKILRGKSNHPSVIRFANSSYNVLEYEVVDVIDDQNATLAGEFTDESNLKLIVIGTFEPIAVQSSDKNIFLYDSLQLNLNVETVLNTPPNVTPDITFNLARVSIQGSQVVIEDKRTQFWETNGVKLLTHIPIAGSRLFGIESVKWDHPTTPRVSNIVELAWGFTAVNWTLNSSLNIVTVSGGSGGQFEDTSFFSTGDFDGWRIYTSSGKFAIIKSSTKSGSQINLELDNLNPNDFSNTALSLIIVPNVEEIEILASANPSDATNLPTEKFFFPINTGKCKIHLIAYNDICLYNIKYRFKNHHYYSDWFIPATASRYLTEISFTDLGALKSVDDRVYFNYTPNTTNGFIQLIQSSSSYSDFVSRIDLNDFFGIEYIPNLEVTVAPLSFRKLDFQVGIRKQNVVILGSDSLVGDVRYNLITTSAKAGSTFFIYQKAAINNSSQVIGATIKNINIYQDNTTILYTFTNDQIIKGEQYFVCTFDGSNWQVTPFDKKYNGDCVFIKGGESKSLAIGGAGFITVESGFNILNATGYAEFISISNAPANPFTIHGIRFLNGKFVNNLKIRNDNVTNVPVRFADFSTVTLTDPTIYKFNCDPYGFGNQLNRLDVFVFNLNISGIYIKTGSAIGFTPTPASRVLPTRFSNGFDSGGDIPQGSNQFLVGFTVNTAGIISLCAEVTMRRNRITSEYITADCLLYKNGVIQRRNETFFGIGINNIWTITKEINHYDNCVIGDFYAVYAYTDDNLRVYGRLDGIQIPPYSL